MYQYIAHFGNKSAFMHKLINHTAHKVIIKSENMFFVLLKSTHGGGYYYIGRIYERESELFITGNIVHNPDENGNPKILDYTTAEKIKDFLQIAIGFVLFWWAIIILLLIDLFCRMFAKDKDMTPEEILDAFMITDMGCQRVDKPQQ